MFNIMLLHNRNNRFARWRVIDIFTSEKLIHKVIHLTIGQHLTLWNSGITC